MRPALSGQSAEWRDRWTRSPGGGLYTARHRGAGWRRRLADLAATRPKRHLAVLMQDKLDCGRVFHQSFPFVLFWLSPRGRVAFLAARRQRYLPPLSSQKLLYHNSCIAQPESRTLAKVAHSPDNQAISGGRRRSWSGGSSLTFARVDRVCFIFGASHLPESLAGLADRH
jgi:hypothetical protein